MPKHDALLVLHLRYLLENGLAVDGHRERRVLIEVDVHRDEQTLLAGRPLDTVAESSRGEERGERLRRRGALKLVTHEDGADAGVVPRGPRSRVRRHGFLPTEQTLRIHRDRGARTRGAVHRPEVDRPVLRLRVALLVDHRPRGADATLHVLLERRALVHQLAEDLVGATAAHDVPIVRALPAAEHLTDDLDVAVVADYHVSHVRFTFCRECDVVLRSRPDAQRVSTFTSRPRFVSVVSSDSSPRTTQTIRLPAHSVHLPDAFWQLTFVDFGEAAKR